jgi:large subunit ribosomal protein L7/L12
MEEEAMKNSKLEALKTKKEQIEARIKNIESKEKVRAKKDDTRRKVLIGAMVMEQMGKSEESKKKVLANLDGFLTRPLDRKLFGLDVSQSSLSRGAEKSKVQKLTQERKTDENPKQTEKRKTA